MTDAMDQYRTFWRRFWASFFDGLVLAPVGILGDFYFFSPARGTAILISWAVISYSAAWLYSVLLHAWHGQTLGKMAMDVQVLDLSEGRTPTLGQAFLRDAFYIVVQVCSLAYFIHIVLVHKYTGDKQVPGVLGRVLGFAGLGWFLLEILSMLTNSKRRAFHDFIAKTVVLKVPQTERKFVNDHRVSDDILETGQQE
jgi:uncharacterized RDD family membrane protein YckC